MLEGFYWSFNFLTGAEIPSTMFIIDVLLASPVYDRIFAILENTSNC